MKFESKKIDLDLELTTLEGEVKVFKFTGILNAKVAGEVATRLAEEDNAFVKRDGDATPEESVEHLDGQLCRLYNVPSGTFCEATDVATMVEIKKHFVDTLSGVQKRGS